MSHIGMLCGSCFESVSPREEVCFDVWCPRCNVSLADQQWRACLGANLIAAGLAAASAWAARAGIAVTP